MEQQKNSTPFKVRAKTHHLDAMAKMEKAERARIQNTKDLTQLTRTQITIRQKMVEEFEQRRLEASHTKHLDRKRKLQMEVEEKSQKAIQIRECFEENIIEVQKSIEVETKRSQLETASEGKQMEKRSLDKDIEEQADEYNWLLDKLWSNDEYLSRKAFEYLQVLSKDSNHPPCYRMQTHLELSKYFKARSQARDALLAADKEYLVCRKDYRKEDQKIFEKLKIEDIDPAWERFERLKFEYEWPKRSF